MSGETVFVFSLLAVSAALFASNRIRLDIVAMLVVIALMLSGVLTVGESLGGFGDPVVLLVAGLLVVGAMLERTGVAQSIGMWIIRVGGVNESRLLVLIMLAAATLSSIMSSTAVVAIFIPIVLRVAAKSGSNPARMLMPMSYAAMISGMLTLIATTPNLVVSETLAKNGFKPLGFFSFMPIGLSVLAIGVIYVLLFGRRMLGAPQADSVGVAPRSMPEMWEDFDVSNRGLLLRVGRGTGLVGKSIKEAQIETRYGVWILIVGSVGRGGKPVGFTLARPEDVLQEDSLLVAVGARHRLDEFIQQESLTLAPEEEGDRRRLFHEYGSAIVLLHPDIQFAGKSLRELDFRTRFGIHVLGVRRGGKTLEEFADLPLAAGDSLLVAGAWSRIGKLRERLHDFVLLEMPSEYEEARPAYRKAPIAMAIVFAMVALTVFDIVPVVTSVLMAAMAAILTRCLTMEDAYRSISWSSIVLLAGMLPVALALRKTGGTDLIVDSIISGLGSAGPYALMSLLFFLTAGLSLFLSNTASAILIAPVAIQAAEVLGMSPYPFAVTVLVGASAAFASPVASPVVALVVEPGRYRFVDYVKVGMPLMVLTYIVTMVVTPLIFPFG